MSGDRIVGKYGEDQAALFLVSCGMRILAKNVRSGRREVDLVALDGTILVFVEVKTRTTQQYGHPED
ncbi:MAG: YraN family protein, partial [Desulfobacterales bacterium]|nr:YraN family protein [Desulfobacterales bacterium]